MIEPSLVHNEQLQLPTQSGARGTVNLTAPQWQLPLTLMPLFSHFSRAGDTPFVPRRLSPGLS